MNNFTDNHISAEHRLYNDLFKDYNTNIRPVRNENNTIDVSIAFLLDHLDDLVSYLILFFHRMRLAFDD